MMNTDRKLLRLTSPYRRHFLFIILFTLGEATAIILTAYFFSLAVNSVFLQEKALSSISNILVYGFAVGIGRAAMHYGRVTLSGKLSIKIRSSLREDILNRIINCDTAQTGISEGESAILLTEGVDALDAYFSQYLPQLIVASIIPLAIFAFVVPADLPSAIIFLLTAPLIPLFMALIGSVSGKLTARQWKTLTKLGEHFLSIIQGLTTLKLFDQSKAQRKIIAAISKQYRDRTLKVLRTAFISALVLEIIATISTALVAVGIGLRLLYDTMAFQQALFVLMLAPEFYLPLRALGARFHAGTLGRTTAQKLFGLLSKYKKNEDKSALYSITDAPAALSKYPLQFNSVGVSFDDKPNALENLTFTLHPGEKIVIIGATGAGKTTFVRLLLRLIEQNSGEITLGDIPIKDVQIDEWRKAIAYVPQHPYMFHATVEENIRLGNDTASTDMIIQAAKQSEAHDFIMRLPGGYQTIIGERGSRLSAGEQKRLAIARALLKNAQFIVLDEADANLDPIVEKKIREGISQLLKDKTAVLVTHQSSTIQQADRVIVLENGKVISIVTPEELIKNPEYNAAVRDMFAHAPVEEYRVEATKSKHISAPYSGTSKASPGKLTTRTILNRLIQFVTSEAPYVALSLVFSVLTILSGIGLLGTATYIISVAALHPSIAELHVAIAGVRFFGISRGVFRYGERYTSHRVSLSILAKLRVWLYVQAERTAPAGLIFKKGGELLSRFTADIDSLNAFYTRVFAPVGTFLLIASAMTASLFLWVSSAVGLVAGSAYLVAGVLIPLCVLWKTNNYNLQVISLRGNLYTQIIDALFGRIELLMNKQATGRFKAISQTQFDLNRNLERGVNIFAIARAMLVGVTMFSLWGVLIATSQLVVAGALNGIYLAVIPIALLASMELIEPLLQGAETFVGNIEVGQRLLALEAEKPAVTFPAGESMLSDPVTIRFTNVAFRHPEENANTQALEDINLTLSPGKWTAIVGESGSGKTTIAKLLLRFWNPDEGVIAVNDKDIQELDESTLRRLVCAALQDGHLFPVSIRENLLISNPSAEDDQLIEALRAVGLGSRLAELSAGLDTQIGSNGILLSGGEQKRIILARVVLRHAGLSVLDEPYAHLDENTANRVYSNLRERLKDRNVLLITHRLLQMGEMDEIVVLNRGRIIERGTHEELLTMQGQYAYMWSLQQR